MLVRSASLLSSPSPCVRSFLGFPLTLPSPLSVLSGTDVRRIPFRANPCVVSLSLVFILCFGVWFSSRFENCSCHLLLCPIAYHLHISRLCSIYWVHSPSCFPPSTTQEQTDVDVNLGPLSPPFQSFLGAQNLGIDFRHVPSVFP